MESPRRTPNAASAALPFRPFPSCSNTARLSAVEILDDQILERRGVWGAARRGGGAKDGDTTGHPHQIIPKPLWLVHWYSEHGRSETSRLSSSQGPYYGFVCGGHGSMGGACAMCFCWHFLMFHWKYPPSNNHGSGTWPVRRGKQSSFRGSVPLP